MKGRSNDYLWGQTDRLLSLVCLPCSNKCCFVGLGWFCCAWLFPSGCIFFAFLGCWNVLWPRRQQGAVPALPCLATLPSLVLWTGLYWAFNINVHLYKHNQQVAESCRQNLPALLPCWSPGLAGRSSVLSWGTDVWPGSSSGAV